VLTHQLTLTPDIVDVICKTAFSKFPFATRVKLFHVDGVLAQESVNYPIRCAETTTYFQLSIKADTLSHIARDKRNKYEYYQRRFFREFRNANFVVKQGEAINEHDRDEYIEAYEERTSEKLYKSYVVRSQQGRLREFLRLCGYLFILKDEDVFVAGCLCARVGSSLFLRSITHKPVYDKYSPGKLCLYMAIKQVMNSDIKLFDFQPVFNKYKLDFGGEAKTYLSYVVYRNRLAHQCDKALRAMSRALRSHEKRQ
jgi:hypothetical protein